MPAIKVNTDEKLYRDLWRGDNKSSGEDKSFLDGTTDAQRATLKKLMRGAVFTIAEDGTITVIAGGAI